MRPGTRSTTPTTPATPVPARTPTWWSTSRPTASRPSSSPSRATRWSRRRTAPTRAGRSRTGAIRQWNANFTEGGPACTIKALEGNTGTVHRPLRGHRLPRLREDGRRARRRHGLHPGADQRREEPPRPSGREDQGQRQAGPRLCEGPLHRGRRLRPRPDQPPAGVHVLRRAGGDEVLPAAAAGPPVPLPRRGDELDVRRRGARPGQDEGHRPEHPQDRHGPDPLRDRAHPRLLGRPEPGGVDRVSRPDLGGPARGQAAPRPEAASRDQPTPTPSPTTSGR